MKARALNFTLRLGITLHPLKVKVTLSFLTLFDPMDYTVHGILQARILEWVASGISRGSSQPRDRTQVSLIAGLFTICATGEALKLRSIKEKGGTVTEQDPWGL